MGKWENGSGRWITEGKDWVEDEDIKQDELKCDSEYVSEAIEKILDASSLLQGIEDDVALNLIHIVDHLKAEWDIEE